MDLIDIMAIMDIIDIIGIIDHLTQGNAYWCVFPWHPHPQDVMWKVNAVSGNSFGVEKI
jgi:hypothetical protein